MTTPNRGSAIEGLTNDLRDASDRTVLRVTQMIDTLPDRGAVDQLLDTVRPRLVSLNPPRPPRIRRVLFSPLDAVIIPTSQWHPGSCAIPRSLLKPVADFIEARLADRSGISAPAPSTRTQHDGLWNAAASILAAGDFPASWKEPGFQAETGIRPLLLPSLIGIVRIILAHAAMLRAFGTQDGADIGIIRPFILEAARSGPFGWRVALTLLVEQSTRPAQLAEQILGVTKETRFARQLNESVELVLGQAIDRLDAETANRPKQGMTSEDAIDARTRLAHRIVSFGDMHGELESLSKRVSRDRPKIAAQFSDEIAQTLRELPGACLTGVASTLEAEDEAAIRIEAMFEAVRRLDVATRPLGDLERREQILDQAARMLAGPDTPAWLTRGDRLRLCEILVGPEAAMRIIGS